MNKPAFRTALSMALLMLVTTGALEARTPAPKRKQTRKAQPAKKLQSMDAKAANRAERLPVIRKGMRGTAVLRAAVLLDRAHFGLGEIDAAHGLNSVKAASAFQASRGLRVTGTIDAATWKALNADTQPITVSYTITDADVAGPFVKVPVDPEEKAKLPSLGYETALEAMAERVHASAALLQQLNRGKSFDRAGETVWILNTERPKLAKCASIVVSQSDLSVSALAADGAVMARYPASTGSEHDPLPMGEWKIQGVARHPVFHYDPNLFWDSEADAKKLTLPAGPNNPVGVVWIDLSKPHYGIHGSPEPAAIGRTQSHGCIRLTNWDATELSAMVGPGTPALLKD
ncbi:MAG: L,D-transpeptidase family protein [Thermoanaerobaculia bacterium]